MRRWRRPRARGRGRGRAGSWCGPGRPCTARGAVPGRRGSRRGGVPMFHPARECSLSPFQDFSLIWSRNHSATPCLTRRTRTVVALAPAMSAGSSVANSGTPARASSFSSLSALNVSRPERSMSSQITAANRGSGDAASASRSASPPSRGTCTAARSWAVPWPRASMSSPPDSMSQKLAAMNHPGGSHSFDDRYCRATGGDAVQFPAGRAPPRACAGGCAGSASGQTGAGAMLCRTVSPTPGDAGTAPVLPIMGGRCRARLRAGRSVPLRSGPPRSPRCPWLRGCGSG